MTEEAFDQIASHVIQKSDRLKSRLSVEKDFVLFGPGAAADSLSMSSFLIDLETELEERRLLRGALLTPEFFFANTSEFSRYSSLKRLIIQKLSRRD